MAEDDLEYHITFPSPTSTLPPVQAPTEEDADESMLYTYNGDGPTISEKEPVVILLGWLGCKDKYLSRYSDLYDKKGCITIRYTAPPEAIFFNPRRTETIGKKILELIPELGLEDNPIFFHVFSNGGAFIYKSITELLHKDDQHASIHVYGCIFDSCPGYRRLKTAALALMSTMESYNIIIRYILATLLVVYLTFFRIFDSIVSVVKRKDAVHRYFELMKNDKARWPQLYLYSKNDKIVPYGDIEEVLSYRRSLGILVYSVCWEDSDHVAHLRAHPEAYTQQCLYFIDKCLSLT